MFLFLFFLSFLFWGKNKKRKDGCPTFHAVANPIWRHPACGGLLFSVITVLSLAFDFNFLNGFDVDVQCIIPVPDVTLLLVLLFIYLFIYFLKTLIYLFNDFEILIILINFMKWLGELTCWLVITHHKHLSIEKNFYSDATW